MKLVALAFAAVLVGCVPMSSSQTTGYGAGYTSTSYAAAPAYDAPSYGTGVYINGEEITVADKAQLEDLLLTTVPPGRYFVDAQGNAGPEGHAAVVNLYVLARQRDAGQPRTGTTEMFSTDAAGRQSSFVSDGNCMMVSSPDVDFASSGC